MEEDSGNGASQIDENTPPPNTASDAAQASAAGGDGGGAAANPPADDAAAASSAAAGDDGAVAGAPSRPSDAEIISFENQLRQQEAERLPFVGDIEPLSALLAEYAEGSEVFRTKIRSLEGSYSAIRRARGDGNCFFRSFLFAYIEDLLARKDFTERHRVTATVKDTKDKMVAAGFESWVFEDPQMLLLSQLDAINGGPDALTAEVLLTNMRDDTVSNMIVSFLRQVVSAEIASRTDFFAPFIMGMSDDGLSVEQFRRRCVEPMGEESDHVHIVALTDALQVPVRVLYLDRSMDSTHAHPSIVNHHDFVPEALAAAVAGGAAEASATQPQVHLLYRPGHYDILYPQDSSGPPTSAAAAAGAAAAARAAALAAGSSGGGASAAAGSQQSPAASPAKQQQPAAGSALGQTAVSAALAATVAAFSAGAQSSPTR